MNTRNVLGLAMKSSAEEKVLATTWRALDTTSRKKKGPRLVSGVAPASLEFSFRFWGDVSKSYHIVAAAKPVVQQLMKMLTRASVLRSSLMMKARVWMIAARD
jgi:hypothetical protein